ncbi:MAG: beta-galactosidase [Cytophagaceae bacterium]|jgi:beta-galactosidase/beta-glucuronidase|nr:beta-galactosidase [Cytophagaceae bacterium]
MKKNITMLLLAVISTTVLNAQWKPQGDKIKTKWAETINPNSVLPEYPRPIMERADWKNLNGLWDYAIRPVGEGEPQQFDGKILVPFAVESSLSGVQKTLGSGNELWYSNSFAIPAKWKNKTILLHFGAVDWKTEVFVNDVKIGTHTGGYTPFSFDVTPFLNSSGNQKLVIKVWDGTDEGFQPRGKQVRRPEGIWYTPVSGIWQTVWLEPVNSKHIAHIKAIPNIDQKRLSVEVATVNSSIGDICEVIMKAGGTTVATGKAACGQTVEIAVSDMKLWSPDAPFLYDLEINLIEKGKTVDKVKSYTAMRKISTKRDENGIVRMQLNNEDCFHYGPLDQGWWPDGLYTAPTDEALLYDIQKTKDFGFNMIRKHVKVEPARWYTHCDRLGILVWQDMPNGDRSPQWQNRNYFNGSERIRTPESEANYRKEWKEIMDYLISNPSVVIWVPFNEAWGQFKTDEIANWTKAYDPSRLVNPASGGNHYHTGDMLDLHNYPGPEMYLYDAERVTVMGEYGGIGLPLDNHLWQTDRNWGYIQFKNSKEVTDEYLKYVEILKKMVHAGFSAAVYTQTTDVEGEVNGLMTYDRKVIKLEEDRLQKANKEVINLLKR